MVFPKVSVCMPVYNGGDYIAESIESVLSQTYEDFDLIVSDNCSTDNTEEIVRSFNDSRVNYFRNTKNLGQTGNVNRCLELAGGEYVCILHHDDIMLRDNLELKVRLLDEHPEVGFVHSNILLIDTHGKVIAENIWSEDSRRDYIEDGFSVFTRYLDYLPYGASIFIGAVVARKKCYDHLGGYNAEIPNCDDSEMWMRMMLFYKVACIGKPLVQYRVHSASASSSWGPYTSISYLKEHYRAAEIVFEKYKDHMPHFDSLWQNACYSFGKRALDLAGSAVFNRDFVKGREFIIGAIRFSPWIISKPDFWKIAAALLAGPKGISFYKAIKKFIQVNHVT
jgi:glycosyltransferase involved in cell wall biosynthesis